MAWETVRLVIIVAFMMAVVEEGDNAAVPDCGSQGTVDTCYADFIAEEVQNLNAKMSRLGGKFKKHCATTTNNTCVDSIDDRLKEVSEKVDMLDSKMNSLISKMDWIGEKVVGCKTGLTSPVFAQATNPTTTLTSTSSPSTTTSTKQTPAIASPTSIPSSTNTTVTTKQTNPTTTPTTEGTTRSLLPTDCSDIYTSGQTESGVYSIYPNDGLSPIDVYCDGGWTLFQKRQDGSVDFERNWTDYRDGFGSLSGEHWLGNKNIARITAQRSYILHIILRDWSDDERIAEYSDFRVADENDNFRLNFERYNGTAGDALRVHYNAQFSTPDRGGCAKEYKAGWWYAFCGYALLNHPYSPHSRVVRRKGISWYNWRGPRYSLKFTEMKMKLAN